MRIFRSGIWSYGVLLVILFCIATIAVWHTITYIAELVPMQDFADVAALIWALTLGFMLIAGAFGLWAIRFFGQVEIRRSIGKFVDAMDYISDGLVTLDRRSRVTGSNPAARRMMDAAFAEDEPVARSLPMFSADELAAFLSRTDPSEEERDVNIPTGRRTYRFRTQPSDEHTLLIISDVTSTHVQRTRARQAAQLQLIGQIAQGVASDFNKLLCAISGYSSLLRKLSPGSPDWLSALSELSRATDRGMAVAAHLVDLSHAHVPGHFTGAMGDHLRLAIEGLQQTLRGSWHIRFECSDDLRPIALSPAQMEQIVVNMAFTAVEGIEIGGTLNVVLCQPGALPAAAADPSYGGVLLLSTVDVRTLTEPPQFTLGGSHGVGIIKSVIHSVIHECGGRMEFATLPDGSLIHRLLLPAAQLADTLFADNELPRELTAYLSGWTVLLAGNSAHFSALRKRLTDIQAIPQDAPDLTSLLSRIDQSPGPEVIVLDLGILANEPESIIRAVLKLRPESGVVVVGALAPADNVISAGIVQVADREAITPLIMALIDARTLAMRRISSAPHPAPL